MTSLTSETVTSEKQIAFNVGRRYEKLCKDVPPPFNNILTNNTMKKTKLTTPSQPPADIIFPRMPPAYF